MFYRFGPDPRIKESRAVPNASSKNAVESVPGSRPKVLSVPGMMNRRMPIIMSAEIMRAKPERFGAGFCASVLSVISILALFGLSFGFD